MCAENVKSWFKSWVFNSTFQAYILPHTLNCMCASLFEFHMWILEQFKCCPKRPRHIKVWVSFELFGALYMYIFAQILKLWELSELSLANEKRNWEVRRDEPKAWTSSLLWWYITLQINTLSKLQFFTVFQIEQYTFAVIDHDM